MKKTIIALFLICALIPASSLAAGKATVTQETFYVTPHYSGSFSGVVYGEITNTGDRAVAIDNGIFEFFDSEGEPIGSGRISSFYPEIINAGENAFFLLSHNVKDSTDSTDIDDYSITVVGKSTTESSIAILSATCSFEEKNDYKNTRRTKLFAVIENNTSELVSNPKVVWAVYDTDGKLIYVDRNTIQYFGLFPGSKAQLSADIDSDIQNIMNANGIEIGEVKVIAWVE